MRLLTLVVLLALTLTAQVEEADRAFREGDIARAEKLARAAVQRDATLVHGHLILGIIAAQRSRWAESDVHFLNVVRLEPGNAFGYFYLGQARLYRKQWAQAIQYFTQARQRGYPDRERLQVELALAHNEAGHPQQAMAELSGGPPSQPRLAAQYHAVMAFAQDRLNGPAAAIESARHALELDDTNATVWDFLIEALIRADEAATALAEAIKAQKKFPDRADTQYLFAVANHHVVESPLSKLALRNLAETEPGSARVALAEGLLLRKEGRTEEAAAAFRRAAVRQAPDAHLLLGIINRENGDYAAAELEFLAAVKQNPRSGQALFELGKALVEKGDLPGARLRLEAAAALMPGASTVNYQLGLLYRRLGLNDKAEAVLNKVRKPTEAKP